MTTDDSSHKPDAKFAVKHAPGAQPNNDLEQILYAKGAAGRREVSCALALQLAQTVGLSPAETGRSLDILEYRINLCQIGLFGHKPVSKIMSPVKPAPEVAAAIKNMLTDDGALSCAQIWDLAKTFKLPKITAAAYCAYLNVKIKPCQLGAF